MAPKELAAYFGTKEKPECHLLYGVASMVNIWGALASEDTRLLKYQIEALLSLPEHSAFVNYVRCHDDIGWGFDENKEREIGIDPLLHKIYQYRFWAGKFPGSYAQGDLYNYDSKTLDARTVGTTASLIGLGSAKNREEEENAVRRFRLIYSTVFVLKGLPLINSGDEIGMLNDEGYVNVPEKRDDSRYLHRPVFSWEKEKESERKGTIENRLFSTIKTLECIRRNSPLFSPDAEVFTWDSHNDKVFAIRRRQGEKILLSVFNYSHEKQKARLSGTTDRDGFCAAFFTHRVLLGWRQENPMNIGSFCLIRAIPHVAYILPEMHGTNSKFQKQVCLSSASFILPICSTPL